MSDSVENPRRVGGSGPSDKSKLITPNKEVVEDKDQPEGKGKHGRIKTTVAELGNKLPIGILDTEGRLHKDIAIKPWKTSDEREIGRKKKDDSTLPEHVGLIVSEMCSQLGPHNLDDMKDAEKLLSVSQMYMGDVFYTYCLIRIKALHDKLNLKITCPQPRCGKEFDWSGNLNSLEVGMVDSIDDILWSFELKNPFEIRRKEVKKFMLASPKWTMLEQVEDQSDEAEIKIRTLKDTIVGINDGQEPVMLTMAELDDLSKLDFEDLIASIDERYLGPNMAVEGKCPKDHSFMKTIDWKYDNFFGGSSR